jgi:hypothetical protein
LNGVEGVEGVEVVEGNEFKVFGLWLKEPSKFNSWGLNPRLLINT